MMGKKVGICLLLLLFVLSTPALVSAGTLTASGTQIKGTASRSNVLKAEAFYLPAAATITAVNCNLKGAGLWIEGFSTYTTGEWNVWQPATKAIGWVIPKGGPYRVYPTVPADADQASCSATFVW